MYSCPIRDRCVYMTCVVGRAVCLGYIKVNIIKKTHFSRQCFVFYLDELCALFVALLVLLSYSSFKPQECQ